MAKLSIKPGTTSLITYVFIGNSSVTTGAGLTGLAYNSSGLTAYYVRPGAAAAAITLATQTTTGAYSSGGFVEMDATNMPGVYRLDIPDAVIASGVRSAIIHLKGATNMVPVSLEIDLNAEVNVTHYLGTAAATPNTAGVPLVDIGRINGNATSAARLAAGARSITLGTVSSATATSIVTNITGYPNDAFNSRVMCLYDQGTLGEQLVSITDYVGSTGTFTVSGFTSAPSASDTVVIM